MNTNKPLSEWTAKEIVEECTKQSLCSSECQCYNPEARRCCFAAPRCWDLSEPPCWTEQDKEDAMMIKRLIPWANQVNRGMEGSLSLNPVTAIDRKLFPLLKPGESAMLDEIIGGTNE